MLFPPVSDSIFLPLVPRNLLPSPQLLSLFECSCTPVMQMVTLKRRRHWSHLQTPRLFMTRLSWLWANSATTLFWGKKSTLQQHSWTVGNKVGSCPPYTEQGGAQQDASKVRDPSKAGLKVNVSSKAEIWPMDSHPTGWSSAWAASNTHRQIWSQF